MSLLTAPNLLALVWLCWRADTAVRDVLALAQEARRRRKVRQALDRLRPLRIGPGPALRLVVASEDEGALRGPGDDQAPVA